MRSPAVAPGFLLSRSRNFTEIWFASRSRFSGKPQAVVDIAERHAALLCQIEQD
jgi:hypothetical protein